MRVKQAYDTLPPHAPDRHPEFVLSALRAFVLGMPFSLPADLQLEWHWLSAFSSTYRLGPLFLSLLDSAVIPPALAAQWRQERVVAYVRYNRSLAAAAQLFTVAEAHGLPLAAMRGLITAHTLWGDPALRPMTDVDLLIEQRSLPALQQALGHEGITPVTGVRQQLIYHLRHQRIYHLQNTVFELHWALLTLQRFHKPEETGGLLKMRRQLRIDQVHLYHLPATVELVIDAAHLFTHHALCDLRALLDIALLLQHGDIDWDWLAAWGKHHRLTRIIAFTLGFANALFSLGQEENLAMITGSAIADMQRYYPGYRLPLFGEDSSIQFCRRQRSLFTIAETQEQRICLFLRSCLLFRRKA